MIARFFRLFVCQLVLAFACAGAQAADGIEITRASIAASDEGYRLSSNYSFDLTPGLEQAVMHGVALYFTTEIELTRPRWWWYDDKAVSKRRTVRLHYDLLNRQYTVQVIGSLQQSFATLDEALFLIRRPWQRTTTGARPGLPARQGGPRQSPHRRRRRPEPWRQRRPALP